MEIKDYKGQKKEIACLACARENGEVTLGDIVRSDYFDAHQDYSIAIPGFIIISSRRHIQSMDEFTSEEQADFIEFLCRVRSAMRQVLGIEVVHMYQREDTEHHFHLWIMPRYDWMRKFGAKVESARPIIDYAKKELCSQEDIEKVEEATEKLKNFFQVENKKEK